jgi:hypothetical protein
VGACNDYGIRARLKIYRRAIVIEVLDSRPAEVVERREGSKLVRESLPPMGDKPQSIEKI